MDQGDCVVLCQSKCPIQFRLNYYVFTMKMNGTKARSNMGKCHLVKETASNCIQCGAIEERNTIY